MNPEHMYLHLGASLYVPATRPDLVAHANGEKLPFVRSFIFDTEDSVRDDQLRLAMGNLEDCLPEFRPNPKTLRFIRVRNPHIMGELLSTTGIQNVDGFVLPKVTRRNIRDYMQLIGPHQKFVVMPTLETEEVFDPLEMLKLRNILLETSIRNRILSLRIGGNDLLNCLSVRRSPKRTIYFTALGGTIATLVGLFKPYGFNLSAPVFEGMDFPKTLAREVQRDLAHGLFGKTAIHPNQVPLIEQHFQVEPNELEAAKKILEQDAPAVFKMHGCMCEPTTHRRAAATICARAELYGVKPARRERSKARTQIQVVAEGLN